jgi:putative tryptophan/tyrosine transport system substrate-binding protein
MAGTAEEGGPAGYGPRFIHMYLPTSSVFVRDAQRLAAFALRRRVISCFSDWPMVDAGGLMSYAADRVAAASRAAELADRIARGVKPEDLPVEQSARFVLKINLKTAQALGLTFPQAILARADEVIE